MSVTTTANPVTQSVLQLLADYKLTHSGDDTVTSIELNARSGDEEKPGNPPTWTTNYNDVPPYRPINYELDREMRPWARPGIETAFVWIMLNGVGTISAIAKAWRSTGGRLNPRIFQYSIGGER